MIAVISDRPFTRDLVVDFLHQHGFLQASGHASCGALLDALPRAASGLVFVDLENERDDVSQLMRELRESRPQICTIAIGTPMQLAAQAGGADGWIELSEPASRVTELASALARPPRAALRGPASSGAGRLSRTWRTLTPRQRDVLALLGCGMDTRKLAVLLGISERAVKAHISALLDKFKADSRTELALIACRANLHAPIASFPFRP